MVYNPVYNPLDPASMELQKIHQLDNTINALAAARAGATVGADSSKRKYIQIIDDKILEKKMILSQNKISPIRDVIDHIHKIAQSAALDNFNPLEMQPRLALLKSEVEDLKTRYEISTKESWFMDFIRKYFPFISSENQTRNQRLADFNEQISTLERDIQRLTENIKKPIEAEEIQG